MGKRGVSIIDIADMAGVSKATVSNVLNGTGRVSEKTRAHVLEIAEREGYVANFAAKSLRATETKTVGIITPDISNVFFSSVVMRLERELYAAGYTSFVCDTESDPEREASYIRSMRHKQVDGLVFVSGTHVLDLASLPAGMPVVTVDRLSKGTHEPFGHVGSDTRQMVYDMTSTLLRRDCTRIVLLVVSAAEEPFEQNRRYLGYVEALAEAGVQLDHRLVLRGRHERPSNIEAAALIDEVLEAGVPFDGVVAMGDRVAFGAMDSLVKHGLPTGKDVLVIGCDNTPLTEFLRPQLSSVSRHVGRLASSAAEMLLAFMSGEEPAGTDVTVPHEVIERASTLGE